MKDNLFYKVLVDDRVVRELRSIPQKDADRIIKAVESLSGNPRPYGTKRLVKQPGWRIRMGKYRILYEIDDLHHIVNVYRAGHRRNVYR